MFCNKQERGEIPIKQRQNQAPLWQALTDYMKAEIIPFPYSWA